MSKLCVNIWAPSKITTSSQKIFGSLWSVHIFAKKENIIIIKLSATNSEQYNLVNTLLLIMN